MLRQKVKVMNLFKTAVDISHKKIEAITHLKLMSAEHDQISQTPSKVSTKIPSLEISLYTVHHETTTQIFYIQSSNSGFANKLIFLGLAGSPKWKSKTFATLSTPQDPILYRKM